MKTTIETINGKKYTIIWNSDAAVGTLEFGGEGMDCYMELPSGLMVLYRCCDDFAEDFAVALPAIKRASADCNERRIRSLYAAHGIIINGINIFEPYGTDDETYKRVDVAIEEAQP